MQKVRVVILDGDGTVFDGVRRAIAVFCRLLATRGVKITPRLWQEAARQWGSKLLPLQAEFFPHLPIEEVGKIYVEMRPHIKIVPYPGMRETLARMRGAGIDLRMQTSRSGVEARRLLGQFGLRDYLTKLICLEDVGWEHAKPSTRGIKMLLADLQANGVTLDEVLFVGDSLEADQPCAAAAEIKFVAVNEERVIPRHVWIDRGVPDANILSVLARAAGLVGFDQRVLAAVAIEDHVSRIDRPLRRSIRFF